MPKSVPSYCHHKASGQAYVKIDGKRIYLGKHGTPDSHRQYAQEISQWQAEQESAPTELTIAQLTLLYKEHARRYYQKDGKPTSKLYVVQAALRELNREYRQLSAMSLTPRRFKRVRERLIDSSNLSRTTINDYMGIIRRLVKWAVGEELLPPENLVALQAVRDLQAGRTTARESEPVRPVELACVQAVEPFLTPPLWGAVQFQLATAARPSEALSLRLRDIDRSGDVWIYQPGSHKTQHYGKKRFIFCGPRAQAIINQYVSITEPEVFVFGVRPDKPYRRDSYTNAITRACERAFGMPDELRKLKADDPEDLKAKAAAWRRVYCWSPNQLRHTTATHIRKSADVETAKTILGHADIRTSEIYAERDFERAAQIIKEIG